VEPHHFDGAGAETFRPAPAPGSKNHTKFYQNHKLFKEMNCMSNLKLFFMNTVYLL
jgi:hypothetical protein